MILIEIKVDARTQINGIILTYKIEIGESLLKNY